MGGVLIGRRELVEAARERLTHLGGTLGPFDAWMALGGLKTLGLRMKAHSDNAVAVARYLAGHAKVTRVEHPALAAHPQHALAAALYPQGTGGMLAFEVVDGYAGAARLIHGLAGRIPLAPSLADVSTTLSYPAGTSHRSLPAEARAAVGISDGLLRLSVGIEDAEDIIADLEAGLAALAI
jgi:cystathionine gamma-synthase